MLRPDPDMATVQPCKLATPTWATQHSRRGSVAIESKHTGMFTAEADEARVGVFFGLLQYMSHFYRAAFWNKPFQ